MPQNVRIKLGSVRFQKKASPNLVLVERPYLWTVYFKIDDAAGSGDPIATVVGAPGSHGNLGVGAVSSTKAIPVPSSIGQWESGLVELPNRPGTINGLVGAIVGVVAILMEEDNVSDDGAEAGRRELVKQIQLAMDGIAADLSSALTFDAEALAGTIRPKVEDAIRAQQNFLENLWSGLDKDDFIGSMIWNSLYGDLPSASTSQTFSTEWGATFADWSLTGRATTFTESRPRLSKTALEFGSVQAGLVRSKTFTISNFTPLDLSLVLTIAGSQRFRLSRSVVDVPRSRQASVKVDFFPVGPGVESGSVVVKRRASNATLATILLSGSTPTGPAP